MKLWFNTRHTAAYLPMLLVAFLLVLAICWLRPVAAHAGSSWLIDEMRFHASAHSALSCTDCHTDIAEAAEHPTAKGLNQPGSTAFSAEGCYKCHSEVEDELAKGKHAGKTLVKGQDYAQCITCHNPHYVLGAEARAKGLRKGGNISQSCNVCHEMKKALPVPAADVAACLTCHGLQTGVAQAASGAAAVSDGGKGAAPQAQISQGQTSQGQAPQGQISQAQAPKGQAPQGQSQQALALLVGLVWAALFWRKEKKAAANAPRHDWPALWLLLAITVTGFVLEGMRIALTGMPDGSEWAFAGHALASLFNLMTSAELARVYGWGWYAHAIVTAATVAYMPFSQLRHIVATPVFLLVQTLRGRH